MNPLAAAALFALLLFGLVVGFWIVSTFNAVIALQLRIDKAWANVEVALKQRYDQLPNLVSAVRDLMTFERTTLERVTELRAAFQPEAPVAEQAVVSEATSAAVRQLFAVVERYPELRSQENVLDLQNEIERLEGLIADRRELYNDQVYRYDTRIAQVPTAWLAALFGWQPREFFDAEAAVDERPDTDLSVRPR
jgi:LemA protein